jgi:glucosamine 6-phosphate synthetase-like amidotransferase/phosphosugar isomerase protein
MCAIFGSSSFDKFCKLYELNKPRGVSASSVLILTEDNKIECKKTAGAFDEYSLKPSKLYLGHCQAPTTQQQEFCYDTAHPFYFDRFYVAHNGIITNAEELAKEYKLQLFDKTQVDSSVVPELISQFYNSKTPLQIFEVIKIVAEKLKGTFACYIFCQRSNRAFLIRSGSTLFYDKEGNFSSTKFDRAIPFEEGKVGEFVNNKIIYHCPFITNSPFFI